MSINPISDQDLLEASKINVFPKKHFLAIDPSTNGKAAWFNFEEYFNEAVASSTGNKSWIQLVSGYKQGTLPTLLTTILSGDVYEYTFETSTSDVVYYRHIGALEDAFYESFSGGVLSDFIVKKETVI